jgi:hypothetical protein
MVVLLVVEVQAGRTAADAIDRQVAAARSPAELRVER